MFKMLDLNNFKTATNTMINGLCKSKRTIIILVAIVVFIFMIIHFERSARNKFQIESYSVSENVRALLAPLTGEPCVKRLPQVIIGGVLKCGTKALITFLNRHPQIAACMVPDEVHYFDKHYDRPLSWYRREMPCSYRDQLTLEKTPNYHNLKHVPHLIKKMNPAMKVIIVYKEPIFRMHSEYLMDKARGMPGTNVPFADTFLDSHNNVNSSDARIAKSSYVYRTKNWQRNFPAAQLCYVDGQKLEADPVSELSRIETFLNISHVLNKDMFVYNETKGKYCVSDRDGTVSCLTDKKGVHHPDLDTDLILKLQDYFKPLNEEFFTLIGRRFDWGY